MKKGRSQRLIELRDKKLIERYYYWSEIKRRRFDDILKILSEREFFISETRIQRILHENNSYLNQLITEGKNNIQQLKLFS